MTRQSISFEGFVPFGTKLREQTVPLGNAIPVGAQILEQTADKLTIRVPECGGGVLLTGPRGCVGHADWNAAQWLAMDVNYPQPEQFALCLCLGVYRYDQIPEKEPPYFGVLTGTFSNYKTRISVGFNEFACKNGFLPRTPGKLKTVSAGLPIAPDEVCALYIGARACHVPQTIELSNLFLCDEEPDYPMQDIKMVDVLGQWTQKDWPGKMHGTQEMVDSLRRELTVPALPPIERRSAWGGNLDMKLTQGTGFYATHRDQNGKWWLVDPQGYAYFVMGLEMVAPGSSGVVNEWRNAYTWLPDKEGEFAEAWSEMHGDPNRARRVAYSEDVDFAKVNLIRAYGAEWEKKWAELTVSRLDAWGINNVGVSGSPKGRAMKSPLGQYRQYPCFHFVGTYPTTKATVFRDFPDVFSQEYEENAAAFAANLESIKDIPCIVGYFMTNEPEWAFIEDLEISEMLLAHPDHLVTKDRFIDFVREKYGTIAAFNKAWNLHFLSFDELLSPIPEARKLSQAAREDLDAFSYIMIEQYIKVPALACKKVDPNHLNFGMRYPYIAYANQTAGHQFLDVFDINDYRYDPKDYIEWIGSLVDMPIMVSEFHHGALDRGLPVTGIRGVRSQEERGVAYRYYIERGASTDYFVGSIYFVFSDQPILCTNYQENYNIGFVDICQMPHTEITDAVRKTAMAVYDVHAGQRPNYDKEPDIIPLNAC